MQTRVKFRCPECDVRLTAKSGGVGREVACPSCQANVTIPMPRALVPLPQQGTTELVEDEPPRPLACRVRRQSKDVPLEMHLPGQLGSMKATVDRKTSNTLTASFMGGLLVAVGAVLFAMFGGKSRSA